MSAPHVDEPPSVAGGEAGLYVTFVAATLFAALLGVALFWPRTARPPLESTHFGALPRTNVLMLDEPAPMR